MVMIIKALLLLLSCSAAATAIEVPNSGSSSSIQKIETTQETQIQQYNYTERLTIQPFPRNRLLTSFEFESYSDPFHIKHLHSKHRYNEFQYGAFPRSLGQIMDISKSEELHLRFSQGWWDAEGWGAPPRNGTYAGGIGVEVWASVEGDSQEEAMTNWSKLVNTLSGLFCASLNFIDSAQTAFPQKSFVPEGSSISNRNLHVLRGSLPREPVCTENLTPFIKLLPCKGKAGISSLLDGQKIFDAQWQGMAIDAVLVCDESKQICKWKLTQVVDAIIDVPRSLRRKVSPVPKPLPENELRCDSSKPYSNTYQCFPLGDETDVRWALSDIFGRSIAGSCPLSSNFDHIAVKVPSNWDIHVSSENRPGILFSTPNNAFTLKSSWNHDVYFKSSNSSTVIEKVTPSVYMERSFTGYGQDRGGIRTEFSNPLDTEAHFIYLEVLPWYMRPYLHTLELKDATSKKIQKLNTEKSDVIKNIIYFPAIDRLRPTQLEIEMVIQPKSTVVLSYDFDKTLLFIEEYPPDANHGFEIPPAVLTMVSGDDNNKSTTTFTIRSTSLLLTLPTPDFSMPYNVIILTCTVMALGFGSIFNLLTKRVVTESESDLVARNNPIRKKIDNIKGFISKLKGR
ncbi:uncharacterized protein SAPINGB_P000488 [Magnusiomyces paraingens]|uniref:GPI transamidase component GPI16 n=1 Tax=Magnusiomyces paraingens TaxID=2606893 RepID=A0A5E8AZK2_9ASCO|nr:uncharacterized protein SAPINGB_P000488 [Saprochaete ingens]VVT44654.1 unnamed protein product [Saprochaete ingens]